MELQAVRTLLRPRTSVEAYADAVIEDEAGPMSARYVARWWTHADDSWSLVVYPPSNPVHPDRVCFEGRDPAVAHFLDDLTNALKAMSTDR